MKRPFILAQVALKAYAVVFVLLVLLLLTPTATAPLNSFAVAVIVVFIGIVIGLLSIVRGLSKGRLWAQISAYVIFIGLTIITVPVLSLSIGDGNILPEFVWPQIWVVTLLCLGVFSLIFQKPNRVRDIEHVAPEHAADASTLS